MSPMASPAVMSAPNASMAPDWGGDCYGGGDNTMAGDHAGVDGGGHRQNNDESENY